MYSEEIADILHKLEVAFGELPIPPDDRIVYDNSEYHLECKQIREKLRRRHWRDLHIDDLVGESDSLLFLTPEAFRFFLPAFIRASVLDPGRADLIPDAILSSLVNLGDLIPNHNELGRTRRETRDIPKALLRELVSTVRTERDESRKERRDILSADQKSTVKTFISFLRCHRRHEFPYGELDRVEEALIS